MFHRRKKDIEVWITYIYDNRYVILYLYIVYIYTQNQGFKYCFLTSILNYDTLQCITWKHSKPNLKGTQHFMLTLSTWHSYLIIIYIRYLLTEHLFLFILSLQSFLNEFLKGAHSVCLQNPCDLQGHLVA